jgi:PAS domain S-box-containing protein
LYELVQQDRSIFEFLQRGSLDGVWYWDITAPEIEWLSPRFWELLGFDPAEKEHLAKEWQGLINPEDLEVALSNFKKHCADPNHPYDQTVRYRHKDGSTVWVRCRGLAIRDDAGNPIRLLGAHTDITELKRTEEALEQKAFELKAANEDLSKVGQDLKKVGRSLEQQVRVRTLELRESEERLKTMIERAPDSIVYVKQDGTIELVNQRTEAIFGYDQGELIGQPLEVLLPESLRNRHRQQRKGFFSEPRMRPMGVGLELNGLRKDGSKFPVEISLSFLKVKEGIIGCATIRDITRRKEELLFQSLASQIAARFVDLPAETVDKTITEVLREIGEYFEVDRVCMTRFSTKGDVLEATNLWHSERFPDIEEASSYAYEQTYAAGASHLVREGSLVSKCLEEFPDWKPERKMLKHLGIKASVVALTSFDGSELEVLALDSLSNRDWPDDAAERAQFLGRVLFNAVDRKREEEKRRKAHQEIKKLKQLLEEENLYLRKEISVRQPHSELIGNSEKLQRLLSQVEQVADTNATILILGETGTGKELIARHLHSLSGRSKNPLITVNCSALPTTLVESELFGREKGAYTGAMTRQVGRFELANRSAIFLDEVGDLPLEIQTKLLRVLEEGEFERLGTPHSTKVDVRIIAATNRNLQAMVKEGKFREDLYYRLNVIQMVVPPLRERPEDISLLVWHFVENFCAKQGKRMEQIKKKDMAKLRTYSWPGNVRELRNLLERAVILSRGTTLELDWTGTEFLDRQEFAPEPLVHEKTGSPQEDFSSAPHREVETTGETLEEMERSHILSVLKRCNWRVGGASGAAEILGMKRTTLDSRLKKLGIERPKPHRLKKKQTTS